MGTLNWRRCGLFFLALGAGAAAFAQQGSVTITSPADGAQLDAKASNKLDYEVVPGGKGDHIHFYVDDEETGIIRSLQGSYTVKRLTAGDHTLCIKVADRSHMPTGVEKCIHVMVR
jgi:hypothetical protein